MSMTFWAYTQVDGKVLTDREDLSYIYKFLDQLDDLCRIEQLPIVSELCNYSEILSVVDEDIDGFDEFSEYDESIHEDSDAVVWMDASEARDLLVYLLNVLENDSDVLESEEDEYEGLRGEIILCLDTIHTALHHDADASFNLSLIM